MPYFQRATVYLGLGRTKSALPDLDKTIELKPDFLSVSLAFFKLQNFYRKRCIHSLTGPILIHLLYNVYILCYRYVIQMHMLSISGSYSTCQYIYQARKNEFGPRRLQTCGSFLLLLFLIISIHFILLNGDCFFLLYFLFILCRFFECLQIILISTQGYLIVDCFNLFL